ncbi:hypothetical protein L2E82_14618 [Cichorium intybus]|uniref:Uncharacterized protein n=1 Tax=Cichorium intybus TaxID=13427 RepID=A0ACB9F1S5_CICIN|nr:hypothetical protein L2E82_14618 [Cichorium intybus]
MSTHIDINSPFLESIRKHLFDDHLEICPNNFPNPISYQSYDAIDWSFLENSEELSVNMEESSSFSKALNSSKSSDVCSPNSSQNYPVIVDDQVEPSLNLDELFQVFSILDNNNSDGRIPCLNSSGSMPNTPHIFPDNNTDFREIPTIFKETQPEFSPVTVSNLPGTSNSSERDKNKPLKWDFSTGHVVQFGEEKFSIGKESHGLPTIKQSFSDNGNDVQISKNKRSITSAISGLPKQERREL